MLSPQPSEILHSSLASILIVIAGVILFLAHYWLFVVKKPRLFTGNTTLRLFLEKHVPTHKKSYKPPFFLPCGILQTAFTVSVRPDISKTLNIQREVFRFSDGGEAALDVIEASTQFDGEPLVVLILPGYYCTTKTTVVSSLVNTVVQTGCTAVVLNYRGYGGISFKSPKFNIFADYDDLREVIPYIKKKFSGSRLMAIGQSAGSLALSRYMREHQKEAKEYLVTAMMISLGWDIVRGYTNLNPPHYLNRLIIHRMHLKWMKLNAAKYAKQMGEKAWKPAVDFPKAMKASTIYDFDKLVLIPQFEFESVEQYWQNASSRGKVLQFPIPVFCLNAQDDPAMPGKLLPYDEAQEANSKLALLVTAHGGHLGFIDGMFKKSEHTVERLAREYVTAVRTHGHELSTIS